MITETVREELKKVLNQLTNIKTTFYPDDSRLDNIESDLRDICYPQKTLEKRLNFLGLSNTIDEEGNTILPES